MAYEGPYGSTAGVQALTRHIRYGEANNPTVADLERWLTARAAQLTGWLAAAGYVVPVVLPAAKAALDRYADYGAASDAEAAQRSGGYTEDDEDRREVFFAREFRRAEEWIASGALAALGVPLAPDLASPLQPRGGAVGLLKAGTSADPRLQRKGGLR
jgi:hypothetical protein